MSRRNSTRAKAHLRVASPSEQPQRDALRRVHHDLRSIVNAVLGYSSLLGCNDFGPLNEKQRNFVAHIRTAAGQLDEIVHACIELSRPSGSIVPTLDPVALELLLANVSRCFGAHSLAYSVELDQALASEIVHTNVPVFERALLELGRVVWSDGNAPCSLSVVRAESLTLKLRPTAAPHVELSTVDELDGELSNREFVRLKLAEVLLERVDVTLRVGLEPRVVELHWR